MKHRVSVIGLGVMGQRMLANMRAHDRFEVLQAWDPDPDACARTAAQYPELDIAASAARAIEHRGTSVVYIACPPAWHGGYATAAFAAGKSVYCEKPLAVDVAESRALVDAAARAGAVNIVNFSLASAAATREVERRLAGGDTGTLAGVDDLTRWGLEAAYAQNRFSAQAEYFGVDLDRSAGADLSFDGYYLYASYFLTQDARPYKAKDGVFDRVKPSRAAGAWEVALRFSNIDLNDADVRGGEEDNVTLGVNYYATSHLRFSANYIAVDTDEAAGDDDPNILVFRAQFDF